MTAPLLLPNPRHATWGDGRVAATDPVTGRDPGLPPQGYRLQIGPDAVRLDARDDAGEHYGRATLAQLRDEAGTLPRGEVRDWPDLAVRGVMLDISRTKVPTIETLEALIDRLAGWKVNHIELYTEHTFSYRDHPDVWAGADPITPGDLARLAPFCAERHVELTANQNCLGHMERWLRHDRYRNLALSPDGFVPAWGGPPRAPTTLDPANPDAFALVEALLDELVPYFGSDRVHVGLDEPWELVDAPVSVYLDWMRRLRSLPRLEGREMLVWGDILAHHPEALDQLPEGVTVCEWGYEADHPFPARGGALQGARRAWWACPGTSSWNSVVGRLSNAKANCLAAAGAAAEFGAEGWLLTDWGDNGHLQYLPIAEPGFAYGAAVAWCRETNADLDLAGALSRHAFDDPTGALAGTLLRLGDLYRASGVEVSNNSVLCVPLYWPHARLGSRLGAGLTDAGLAAAAAALDDAMSGLGRAAPGRVDGDLIKDELTNGARLMGILIDDARARLAGDGRVDSIPEGMRLSFGKRLDEVIAEHRRLWTARNRRGGLDESAAWLERVAEGYRTGHIPRPARAYGP